MPILETNKLGMRFGGLVAVSDLDLAVEPGAIFSIIGPNGAGKTTVFNAITGIYRPTSGSVRVAGRELRRPWSWRVAAACILVGVATGMGAALTSVNMNLLWRATVKRHGTDPSRPFTYSAAWNDAVAFFGGQIGIERLRDGRWSVVTPNGTGILATRESRRQAQRLQTDLRALVADRSWPAIAHVQGRWAVKSLENGKRVVLASFATRPEAEQWIDALKAAAAEGAGQARAGWLGLLGGFILGAAGTLAVWRRSRATPDVVAAGGVARTFQNIRLFRGMTVLENVLVAQDRMLHSGILPLLFRTPKWRHEEHCAAERGLETLKFVGLAGRAGLLAGDLPYGDQRRLEIARALATQPRLLLLDEPAAGMNPAETAELMKLIERIRGQGVTVVLIEHHMKLVMGISDVVAVLDYGRKIAQGSPAHVRCDPRVVEAYLGKGIE